MINKNKSILYVGKKLIGNSNVIYKKVDSIKNNLSIINKQNNDYVFTPNLVFSSEKFGIYVSEYFEGESLNNILLNDLSNTKEILKTLLSWFRNFYIVNKNPEVNPNKIPFKSLNPDKYITKLNIDIKKHLIHGDLTPWNIIINKNGKICVLDWDNSGMGYPALDLARFILQLYSKLIFKKRYKKQILKIFWNKMGTFYNYNTEIFIHSLAFQAKYSKGIFSDNIKNSQSLISILKYLGVFLRLQYAIYELKRNIRKLND